MFATFVSVALFSAIAIHGVAADFSVDTPTLIQCHPAQINWSGANGPVSLAVVPSADPCDTLQDLGDQTGSSFTWPVNVPAGQSVAIVLADEDGNEAWSGDVVVQSSSNSSCLSAAAKSSISAAASSSSAAKTSSTERTTLSLAPTPVAPQNVESSAASAPQPGSTEGAAGAVPAGAAAAGANPLSSGANVVRPAAALIAFAAAFLMFL